MCRRDVACLEQLAKLNTHVAVNIYDGGICTQVLNEDLVKFGAVVVTDCEIHLETLCEWDEICRKAEPTTTFILGLTGGLTFTVFSDFGPKHIITDRTGEICKTSAVQGTCLGYYGSCLPFARSPGEA